MIQQVGLFPHQTVADNVATVPRLLGWDKERVPRPRSTSCSSSSGSTAPAIAERYPHQLSGGQRQRVGVARGPRRRSARAADGRAVRRHRPDHRDRLQDEFLRLQAELRKTVVFVTHDVDEAVRLGDRIAVLAEGGHLEQYAPPAEMLAHPATQFVADFVGADRGLKRLGVLPVEARDVVAGEADGLPVVDVGIPLRDASGVDARQRPRRRRRPRGRPRAGCPHHRRAPRRRPPHRHPRRVGSLGMSTWQLAQHGAVAVATFDRPPRNFMSFVAMGDLEAALTDVAARDDVNVVVLTGGVPGYFVAHADLDDLTALATGGQIEGDPRSWGRTLSLIESMPQPVVAAINGQAWGGGCELSLACTMRVAAASARSRPA